MIYDNTKDYVEATFTTVDNKSVTVRKYKSDNRIVYVYDAGEILFPKSFKDKLKEKIADIDKDSFEEFVSKINE